MSFGLCDGVSRSGLAVSYRSFAEIFLGFLVGHLDGFATEYGDDEGVACVFANQDLNSWVR